MSTYQANSKIYTDSFDQIAGGNQAILQYRTEEDVWIRAVMGNIDDETADVNVQMVLQNEQPIHTIPLNWMAVVGSATFPHYFKMPILLKKHQTLNAIIDIGAGEQAVSGTLAILVTPLRLDEKPEAFKLPWQVRTQIYGLELTDFEEGGEVLRSLEFDRNGYLHCVMGNVLPAAAIDFAFMSCGFHNGETIYSDVGMWQAHVGTGQRPLWFPHRIPIVAHQSLAITLQNQNGSTTIDFLSLAFQFCPTGREVRQLN